jgi:hypothetical protein
LGKTVQELEDKMSVEEFIEWQVWTKLQNDRAKNGANNRS